MKRCIYIIVFLFLTTFAMADSFKEHNQSIGILPTTEANTVLNRILKATSISLYNTHKDEWNKNLPSREYAEIISIEDIEEKVEFIPRILLLLDRMYGANGILAENYTSEELRNMRKDDFMLLIGSEHIEKIYAFDNITGPGDHVEIFRIHHGEELFIDIHPIYSSPTNYEYDDTMTHNINPYLPRLNLSEDEYKRYEGLSFQAMQGRSMEEYWFWADTIQSMTTEEFRQYREYLEEDQSKNFSIFSVEIPAAGWYEYWAFNSHSDFEKNLPYFLDESGVPFYKLFAVISSLKQIKYIENIGLHQTLVKKMKSNSYEYTIASYMEGANTLTVVINKYDEDTDTFYFKSASVRL